MPRLRPIPIHKPGSFSTARICRIILYLWYPVATAGSIFVALKGLGVGAKRPNIREHWHPPKSQKSIEFESLSDIDKSYRERMIREMINIYNGKATKSDTMKIYEYDVKFNDPIVSTNGKTQLASIIHGLPLILDCELDNLEIDHYCHAIVLKYDWSYKFKRFQNKKITMPITTYLELNKDCTHVTKHKDLYYGRPLLKSWLFSIPRIINGGISVLFLGIPSGAIM